MKVHALAREVLLQGRRHLRIERRHHLRQLFKDRDRQLAVDQVLYHLQADEAATNNDRGLRVALGDPRADAAGIGNTAHGEHPRQFDPRQRRPDRCGPRREYENVVGLLSRRAVAQVTHHQHARSCVDGSHLGVGVHCDVEALAEHLARRNQQLAFVGDHVADVVGQAAVGEGDIRTAVEDDDLTRLIESSQARRAGRATGDAADDQDTAARPAAGLRLGVVAHVNSCAKSAAMVRSTAMRYEQRSEDSVARNGTPVAPTPEDGDPPYSAEDQGEVRCRHRILEVVSAETFATASPTNR